MIKKPNDKVDIDALVESAFAAGDSSGREDSSGGGWPDWAIRLAANDELTDTEAAAAFAGIDPDWLDHDDAPWFGRLVDVVPEASYKPRARIASWQETLRRAIVAGALVATPIKHNKNGVPICWSISLRHLAVWCASRNSPLAYPLPGNPSASVRTTDADLRDALVAAERDRDEWRRKAVALDEVKSERNRLRLEKDRLQTDLDAAQRTATAAKADLLAGKNRTSALRIIGGMAIRGYGFDIHGARFEKLGELLTDLESAGAVVDRKVLRRWLRDAAEVIDPRQVSKRADRS